MISHSDLARAEKLLRRDDKAIRLRFSREGPNVLVERKTFRGTLGAVAPGGYKYLPDAGRRHEEGHLPVCSLPREGFSLRDLRDSLRAADSWRMWDSSSRPLWRRVEEAEDSAKSRIVRARKDNLRYKAEEVWNRYAWTSKSRVSVPGSIR